jgi:hypothetical protein
MIDVTFSVSTALPKRFAASPTIVFGLHVTASQPIEAAALRVQLRIEPQWRSYAPREQALLRDLFGTPDRWQTTLRALSWADLPVAVPGFVSETDVEVNVPCTYDFDVTATRFLNALGDGEIPVRFLFSGAIFRDGALGFSTERVSWSSECAYRMPLDVWRGALRACYGDDALIRISRETLEQLQRYRALSGARSWDELFERLLVMPT